MGRTNIERETVIIYNDAEDVATLWTASPVTRRQWDGLGLHVSEKGGGWQATVSKRCVRVKNPLSKKVLSPEHMAALLRGRRAVEGAPHARTRVEAAHQTIPDQHESS